MLSIKEREPALKPSGVREKDVKDRQPNLSVRKGFEYSSLITFTEESEHLGAQVYSIYPDEDFYSPRHRHSETLVRYLVSGTMKYGKEEHAPGDCTIVTDSVRYGPMQKGSGAPPHFLQVTFAGPTGAAPLLPDQLATARAALSERGEFKNGVFFPKDGKPQDAYEALAIETYGEVDYPTPLLKNPMTVRTTDLPWLAYAEGVEIRHVAGLFGTGPYINLLRLKKGATLPAGNSGWQQARYVVEGAVRWGDEDYDAISMFYYPPNVDYAASTALVDQTVLLVIQWTTNLEQRPSTAGGSVF